MTASTPAARRRERLIAIVILAVAGAYLAFGLRTAANSFGCDFSAYFGAANDWLAGRPIYDLSVASTGTCGTYQYPPPFVLVALPFSLFGFTIGTWLWVGFLLACWAIGTAILPVRLPIRWLVLLLTAIGWPLVFGVRIGQVAPILYLAFAVGWRSLDRPAVLGASVAIGTLVKLQPGLLGLWLIARREWRALAWAIGVGLAIVAVSAVLGLADWVGMATLLRSLTDAVTNDANIAIGATLHRQGLDAQVAGLVQVANTIAMLAIVVFAALRFRPGASFLVAVVASQVISPIVWTHYNLVLMLPVAWLLDRRQWWAVVIPVAQIWILVPFIPLWSYTVQFYVVLIAVLAVGWRDGREPVGRRVAARPPLQVGAGEPLA